LARTSMEDRAFIGAWKISGLMGWDVRTAAGALAWLWHESQDQERVDGSAEEIADWCQCTDPAETPKLINALVKAGFLIPEPIPGNYEIAGNLKHITALQKLKASARKGGEANKERLTRVKATPDTAESLYVTPPALNEVGGSHSASHLAPETEPPASHVASHLLGKGEPYSILSSSIRDVTSLNEGEYCDEPAETASSPPAKVKPSGAIPVLAEKPGLVALLHDVSHHVQEAWLLAYQDLDWIGREILKAQAWILANPHKRPKKFGRFMTNWLANGFERHRRGLPTNRPNRAQESQAHFDDQMNRIDRGDL
jgi:hypothetical protein